MSPHAWAIIPGRKLLRQSARIPKRTPSTVTSITNNLDSLRSQSFTYHQFDRIATAQTGATYSTSSAKCWGESYTIDAWANLQAIGVSSSSYNGCTQENLSVTVSGQNQLSTQGFQYDAAGNMTNDGAHTYVYNGEGQIKTGAGVNYTYDGDGRRVEKSNGTLYWYGAGSDALDETDLSGNLTNEYIYFAGRRVARRDSSSNIYFYLEDHLGTSRVITNATGTVCYDADFYPYGGERIYTNTCPQNYKFTGKERDAESGLDDLVARFYSSGLGRFVIADWSAVPEPVPFADLTNPQTLNLYAYVENNPLRYTDPTGHFSGTGAGWSSPLLMDAMPSFSPAYNDNVTGPGADFGQVNSQNNTGGGWLFFTVQADGSLTPGISDAAYQQFMAQQQDPAQNQNQLKYDPSKSGPEDPTNPGKPLSQNPVVKKASDEAFMATTNGQARSCLAEAGFAIEYKDGKISIANRVDSVYSDKPANELQIKTDANTIAILHTHGNIALATPSLPTRGKPGDVSSRVPNFVRSQSALYVTVPSTKTYIQLEP